MSSCTRWPFLYMFVGWYKEKYFSLAPSGSWCLPTSEGGGGGDSDGFVFGHMDVTQAQTAAAHVTIDPLIPEIRG